MQSKSQLYSDLVFINVQDLVQSLENDDKRLKKYKSLCKRSGGVFRTVGLIQFLTFLAAKATKDTEKHHEDLLSHLRLELHTCNIVNSENIVSFLAAIRQQEFAEYMRTSAETLKFLQWHKRISDILIIGTVED
ncbi:Putative CRISPR type III-B/RAMP module RAMP protein Cmr5 [Desulfonema limicola]|uniref:CRISPR type III-B/RAMP module-associated protein Cmr5 n=2 Tax=Desulfonema limicola TaxID=45656 RepID=A0A975GGF2_9BACT|nr:Putative CRISPR type III-B/RAMP module RAMP protein Cmr5 [Desulfonema limicola]